MEKENRIQNELGQNITTAGEKAEYDAAAKKLVSQKPILAYILKSALEEYADVSVERIAEEFIEGTPQVGVIAVHQDHPDAEDLEKQTSGTDKMSGSSRIIGMPNEDASIREGKVFFDIRFVARVPKDDSRMDIIVNVEVQRTDTPGYPITKRGIYYGSRLISAQRGTLFKNQEYNKIRKVVSIWVCSGTAMERSDTINEYVIAEINKRGCYREKRENYDLMRVIVMRLGNKGEQSGDPAIRLLSRIFSTERNSEDKKAVLSEEFHIAVTEEMSQEVNTMCNLSAGIYDKGRQEGKREGKQEGILEGKLMAHFELVRDGILSIAQAGQRMNMEPSLFERKYKEYILKMPAN